MPPHLTKSDLYAGIVRLVDATNEILDYIIESIDYSLLSSFDKSKLLSDINSNRLLIRSMVENLEKQIGKLLLRYQLMGFELKYFTTSIKMILDIDMITDQAIIAFDFLLKHKNRSHEYETLRSISIKELISSCRFILSSFVNYYHATTAGICIKKDNETIQSHESKINRIYESHSRSILNMLKAEIIDIEDSFILTSAIRSFERIGDLCYSLLHHAKNLLENDEFLQNI